MHVSEYDRQWAMMDDFIKFNPGARHRRRWIIDCLKRYSFETLLDVGCGNAETLLMVREALQRPGVKFSGADLSPVAVERNRARLPDMEFQVLDLQKDPLPSAYDMVLCTEVIEHLHDRARAFRNLAAMVKPGGHLVVTCPTGRMYATEKYFGHISHPTVEEIASHAAANGLVVQVVRKWGFPFYNGMKWATNINPEWALKNFGDVKYGLMSKAVSLGLYWVNFFNIPRFAPGCQLFAVLEKPVKAQA